MYIENQTYLLPYAQEADEECQEYTARYKEEVKRLRTLTDHDDPNELWLKEQPAYYEILSSRYGGHSSLNFEELLAAAPYPNPRLTPTPKQKVYRSLARELKYNSYTAC